MSFPLLKANWPAPKHVHAYTSFRTHPYAPDDFNLSPFVGDEVQSSKNRQILAQTLNLKSPLNFLKQVHGADVVAAPFAQGIEGDGCFTQTNHQVCAILTADCLPIVITDTHGSVVCALHGGWRGLAAQIIKQAVSQIKILSDYPLMAWLGPAIGPQAFQVGAEVRQAFTQIHSEYDAAFIEMPNQPNYYLANIFELAKIQLSACGVLQVYTSECCTYSQTDKFYSYRRGDQHGRMATLVWMA